MSQARSLILHPLKWILDKISCQLTRTNSCWDLLPRCILKTGTTSFGCDMLQTQFFHNNRYTKFEYWGIKNSLNNKWLVFSKNVTIKYSTVINKSSVIDIFENDEIVVHYCIFGFSNE